MLSMECPKLSEHIFLKTTQRKSQDDIWAVENLKKIEYMRIQLLMLSYRFNMVNSV